MKTVGIEAMNAYAGSSFFDVTELAIYRNLDIKRFENLLFRIIDRFVISIILYNIL